MLCLHWHCVGVGLIYIAIIHLIYVYRIYIGYFCSKISDICAIFDFCGVFQFFNVTHCHCLLIFSPCVLLAYELCPQHFLSIEQLLSDCTSPQQCSVNDESTSPNMQTHTYILLSGSKFPIILAMYMQMLDRYRKYREKSLIFSIFPKISRYFPTLHCVLAI